MRKILFIDRDGTIVHETDDEQVDRLDKVRYLDDVIPSLLTLAANGFSFVMVTNQDGLGTDSFPEEDFWLVHNSIMELLGSQGITFEAVHIDKSFPHENLQTRKPGVGMVREYFATMDRENSYVIGDRDSDVELARNMGIGAFQIQSDGCTWKTIVEQLVLRPRVATITRRTNETNITADVNLDATAPIKIATGIGFFDHMVEQIARHAGISITLSCEGDLEIDEHHTIEDAGLVLGSAVSKALGDRRGIGRYGFLLPMDEALAQVAIDLSGRPYLVFNGTFDREYVGGMPTEMVEHFFHSFAQTLGATINISVDGENAHHKVESIFKGVGRALRAALQNQNQTDESSASTARSVEVPSSKGTLTW